MAQHAAPTTPTAEPNAPQSPTHYSRPSNTFGFRNYVEGQRLTATADTRFSQDLLRTLQSADDHFTVISDQNAKAARTLGTLEIDLKKNTSAVRNLTTRMTAVEASVARLDASVTGLNTDVTALSRKVNENHQELRDLIDRKHDTIMINARSNKKELTDELDGLEVKVNELTVAVNGLEAKFDKKLDALEGRLNKSFDDKLNQVEGRLNKKFDDKFDQLVKLIERRLPPPPSSSTHFHQPTPVSAPIESLGEPSVPAIHTEGEIVTEFKQFAAAYNKHDDGIQAEAKSSLSLRSSLNNLGLRLQKSVSDLRGNKSPTSPTFP